MYEIILGKILETVGAIFIAGILFSILYGFYKILKY